MALSRSLLPVATATVRGCRSGLPAERAMVRGLPHERKHFPFRYPPGSKMGRQSVSTEMGTRVRKAHRPATSWLPSACITIHAFNVEAHT